MILSSHCDKIFLNLFCCKSRRWNRGLSRTGKSGKTSFRVIFEISVFFENRAGRPGVEPRVAWRSAEVFITGAFGGCSHFTTTGASGRGTGVETGLDFGLVWVEISQFFGRTFGIDFVIVSESEFSEFFEILIVIFHSSFSVSSLTLMSSGWIVNFWEDSLEGFAEFEARFEEARLRRRVSRISLETRRISFASDALKSFSLEKFWIFGNFYFWNIWIFWLIFYFLQF